MRLLVWHVHGSWLTSLVQGPHEYLVPVLPDRGPDGRGRAQTWDWPPNVLELSPAELAAQRPDAVLLQRPHEAGLLAEWTGWRPGVDLPAVYVEHNTPRGDVAEWRHPLADQTRIPIVHVTCFNQAMWDTGRARTLVIEHGILDPGSRWHGEQPRLAMSVNEPVRRWRVAGMDLAARLARELPVDVYGMGVDQLAATGEFGTGQHADLPQDRLFDRLAEHRAYLHTYRWTSLGLSLLEAMALGSPVLVLAATAAPEAVPDDAGVVSSDIDALAEAATRLLADQDEARALGKAARDHAMTRFSLGRFLAAWDAALQDL